MVFGEGRGVCHPPLLVFFYTPPWCVQNKPTTRLPIEANDFFIAKSHAICNLCVVTPVNVNNNLPSNVTSTNSSLHTNLFASPRSTFLNFAVFSSRSVRNKIESIIDHVVDLVKWPWFRQYFSVICGRLFLQEFFSTIAKPWWWNWDSVSRLCQRFISGWEGKQVVRIFWVDC